MNIICGMQISSEGTAKYFVFDTIKAGIVTVSIDYIHRNIRNTYGVKLDRYGNIHYTGYSEIPTFSSTGVSGKELFTLVGKLEEEDRYIIVQGTGQIHKVTRVALLNLIKRRLVTNTLNSVNRVALKEGKLPLIKRASSKVRDTVIKIYDMSEMLNYMSTLGVGEKFYGKRIRDGRYGVVKKTVSPYRYDNINEVLAYRLGKLFGVKVCEASFESFDGSNKNWVMSVYEYTPGKDTIISCKNAFGTDDFRSNFSVSAIEKQFGAEAANDFKRMVIFDLITHQTDRHIRNFSFIGNQMYPLYDNGRCLFWDADNLGEISQIDIVSSFETNEHGYGWSYIDGVLGPYECKKLINSTVKYEEIYEIVSQFYRKGRAAKLSKYMYSVYKLITGGTWFNV